MSAPEKHMGGDDYVAHVRRDGEDEVLSCGSESDPSGRWTGIFSEPDMKGLCSSSEVEEKLKEVMVSIYGYVNGIREDGETEAWRLAEHIQLRQEKLRSDQRAVKEAYDRITEKIRKATEAHSRLRDSLVEMVTGYGQERESAENDLVAARIEMGLIKLSVLRARAHRVLYSTAGITEAYEKLKMEEGKLDDEKRKMEGEMEGYMEVAEDWRRVQAEIEECRSDLARLDR